MTRRNVPDEGGYCEEIVIEADGTVTFKHLSEDLLHVALALAPDDPRLQRRIRLLGEEP